MIIAQTLPLTLSETEFKGTVLDYAHWRRWLVSHFRPARTTQGWRTALEGDAGCPDLILARDGQVLLVELKRHGSYPTPQQKAWLAAAGSNGRLWRPGDWNSIREELN